jgi:hypothetical protein
MRRPVAAVDAGALSRFHGDMFAAVDHRRLFACLFLGLALSLSAVGCGEDRLSFRVLHVKVAHDGFEVLDVALMDAEGDGDLDLVVATEHDLRLLRFDRGGWSDASAGSGISQVPAVQRVHADGRDLLVERDGKLRRLVGSAVGTWQEAADDEQGPAPGASPVALADLDGDGLDERITLDGQTLRVERRTESGWRDLTAATGADGLALPGPGTRLLAGDLDGDGHLDLAVVGRRLFALLSNGGALPTD